MRENWTWGGVGRGGEESKLPPKYVHVLILTTFEYATLCGKRDFADAMQDFEMRQLIILGYQGGPNVITRILMRGRQKGHSQRRRCDDTSRSQDQKKVNLKMLHL